MDKKELFEKLTFKNQKEKEDFDKYSKLKGTYLHKQIYDILLEFNSEEVTYFDLSSIIRYDKNLRDLLYIYFATAEEYLRSKLFDKFDLKDDCNLKGRLTEKILNDNLIEKKDFTKSNLYNKDIYLSDLIKICISKGLININNDEYKEIINLRNKTMHHGVLLIGLSTTVEELVENLDQLEKRLNSFIKLLPENYKNNFINKVDELNGGIKMFLKLFYLEGKDGKIFVKGKIKEL